MLSTKLKRKLATVKSLKADVSIVSASSQRMKLETPAFKIGGQIYVFNSADDAKLPCFVSLRWFPGSMVFENGAGMKTEKPLGTKLPFKSTRSKSRTLSWWVMKLSFGMILFFPRQRKISRCNYFLFPFYSHVQVRRQSDLPQLLQMEVENFLEVSQDRQVWKSHPLERQRI